MSGSSRWATAVKRARRPTVLLLAVWIGLTAGFLDLAALGDSKRADRGRHHRLGEVSPGSSPRGSRFWCCCPAIVLVLRRAARADGAPSGQGRGAALVRRLPRLECEAAPGFLGVVALFGGARRAVGPAGRRSPPGVPPARAPDGPAARRGRADSCAGDDRGLAPGRSIGRSPRSPRRRPPAPNVLLIVWDTVRAENLSLYGYERPTTPNLERLAARGVRFDMRSRRPPGPCRRTPACSPGGGPMSWASTGNRRSTTAMPTLAGWLGYPGI